MVMPAALSSVPPMLRLLAPTELLETSTCSEPVLARSPTVLTAAPLSRLNEPATLVSSESAPSLFRLLLSATIAAPPSNVSEPPAAILVKLPLANSSNALRVRVIEPLTIDCAAPVTSSVTRALAVPASVSVPVVFRPPTVTDVLVASAPALPRITVPVLLSTPVIDTVLPAPARLAGLSPLLLRELGEHGIDRLRPAREKLPGVERGGCLLAEHALFDHDDVHTLPHRCFCGTEAGKTAACNQ